MSFVIRRGLSTLVPPKVANPQGLGAAKDAVRMARIAKFYEKLPKGAAPEIQSSGPISWYQKKYMGKEASAAPIWHLIFSLMAMGYGMEYYFHLRHHKNHPISVVVSGPLTLTTTLILDASSNASVSRNPGKRHVVRVEDIVMAESSLQDGALNTQSAGDNSSSDASATINHTTSIGGDGGEEIKRKENGVALHPHMYAKAEDHGLDDGATRSDEDTSRDNSVTGDTRSIDAKPTKKFTASKPVSFAKYSVPKSSAANAPPKAVVDKAPAPAAINTFSTPIGRSRLVAKTTNTSQQKSTGFKAAAPDPMQVWNKNRATPQPSTKHLTDEELKQQYGIHLTSRLQSDGEGKEAKWADIDDDEDDWAPETIEWNDGTKTTVNPADTTSSKQNSTTGTTPVGLTKSATAPKPIAPQYSSTVGPNATVLKLGANAERQQAQRALAQQNKGPTENPPTLMSKALPAPAPAKSPWAKLPEIDKISPVAINPQSAVSLSGRLPQVGPQGPMYTGQASSPAKEISADDFNRSWRSSPSSQARELFMPSSGRYETVGDGKRRMSKNEQNFRAPAVLQRPSQRDTRTPAEPSPAFQTRRTSIDQGRRRASSSISGGSGQLARRMSFKSTDTTNVSQPDTTVQPSQPAEEEPSPVTQTATYQAHVGNHAPGQPDAPSDVDLDAQRVAQKALMREKIENARQRKLEEEQRLEAEKQERIKLKLASLGPPPEPVKPKQEQVTQEKRADVPSVPPPTSTAALPVQSPPKPPQPHATGEPQQYGMMTVHPLDSVKRLSLPDNNASESVRPVSESPSTGQQSVTDKLKLPSPAVNDVRTAAENTKSIVDETNMPEPSSRFGRPPPSVSNDARAGWGATRNEHRSQQTGNLWGLPSNKALGNGTFDQSLAGYSPQDLSRTSSTGQGWMNGRTPTVGQSPQLTHANQHAPETRSQLIQSMISPEPQPLNINSEVDSALPASRPAPIGRPQAQASHNQTNGLPAINQTTGLAAWNNFQHVARAQERAETEKLNRELSERREEEKRTGVRTQAPYGLQETFKQVQLGDQVGQRHVAQVTQTSHVPSNMFSAVGLSPTAEPPSRLTNGNTGRGSRFFPQQANGVLPQERRSVTYSHPEHPRTPSPPPAEEHASLHPAFDNAYGYLRIHFPREKAVVKLPPAAPPAPSPTIVKEQPPPPQPKVPMTWAARASLPPSAPTPVRAVSTPLVNNPTWQERFNGLFYPAKQSQQPPPQQEQQQQQLNRTQPAPALASTREPLDILPGSPAPSVSLPQLWDGDEEDAGKASSKDVEDEEDLFEDREAGSLPTIHLPRDVPLLQYQATPLSRALPAPVDPNSIHMFMVSNWSERYGHVKPQYAMIKVPGGSGKGIRKDLPVKSSSTITPPRSRNSYGSKTHARPKPTTKARPTTKAH